MRAVAKSFAMSLAVAAVIATAGCDTDTHKADKKIRADLRDAQTQRSLGTEAGLAAAQKTLAALGSESGGSPATRAQLAATRAQMQVDAALALISQIDVKELELSRVSFNLGQLAVQLDIGSSMVTGYSKYDPKPTRDKLAEQIAAAQGGADKPIWDYQSVQLPTIAATKQKISELEGQLAQLQDQVKTLSDQRTAAMNEAESAAQAADKAKGQESVDQFKRASGLRKQAGDLFIQIEATNARMVPIQDDLSIQRGQLDVLNTIVKDLTQQQDTLDTGWKAIQHQTEMQSALAKEIVGSGAHAETSTNPIDEPITVAGKSADIKRRADELKTLRQQAQSDLGDAAKLFGDAYNSAESARRDLMNLINEANNDSKRADVKIWKNMMEIINSQSYRLRQAATQRMLAALYSGEAMSLLNRVNLQTNAVRAIEGAGANVPEDLRPGSLAKDASTALGLADEAYKAADELLGNILSGVSPGKPILDATKVERILTLYGQSEVAKLNGATGPAKNYLEQAIQLRNEALADGAKIPALPAELGIAPAPATAPTASETPTTSPATEPTTAPAAEPATEPAGADAAPATQPG